MININTSVENDVITLILNGDVDASSSINLDNAINDVKNEGHKKILINAQELHYISSAGLGVFMSYIKDFEKEDIKLVVAIGPVPMMKAVSNITKEYNVSTLVSLDPVMVDGTGMCGCCRVTIGGETKFACVDGPEFDAHKVDYDELILRHRSYEEEERKCHNDYCTIRDAY